MIDLVVLFRISEYNDSICCSVNPSAGSFSFLLYLDEWLYVYSLFISSCSSYVNNLIFGS